MRSLSAILEGPDGAGKTTLSSRLRERYGSGYQHAGPPEPDATPASLTRYYAAMVAGFVLASYPIPASAMQVLHQTGDVVKAKFMDALVKDQAEKDGTGRVATGGSLLDRWALGETVYGPLFRGKSLVGPTEWRALVALIDALHVPLVVCLPPRDVCLKNWQDRVAQETFKDRAQVVKAYDAYASWAYGGRPHYARPRWTWIYDYTRPEGDQAFFNFLDALAEKQA